MDRKKIAPKAKAYTLKNFYDDAIRIFGKLPHVESIHIEIGWWYCGGGRDREAGFMVVVYTDFLDFETGNDTKNIRGEGETPQIALASAELSYRRAFGGDNTTETFELS